MRNKTMRVCSNFGNNFIAISSVVKLESGSHCLGTIPMLPPPGFTTAALRMRIVKATWKSSMFNNNWFFSQPELNTLRANGVANTPNADPPRQLRFRLSAACFARENVLLRPV